MFKSIKNVIAHSCRVPFRSIQSQKDMYKHVGIVPAGESGEYLDCACIFHKFHEGKLVEIVVMPDRITSAIVWNEIIIDISGDHQDLPHSNS